MILIYYHEDYSKETFQRLSQRTKGSVFIRALQVNPLYLKRRIASLMLKRIFDTFPGYVYTLIAVNDIKAQKLYTKHGFH